MLFQIIPILTKSQLLKSFRELRKTLQEAEFAVCKIRISGKGSFPKNNLETLSNKGKTMLAANTSDVSTKHHFKIEKQTFTIKIVQGSKNLIYVVICGGWE